ncbi:MAG: diaminopimelate epimerase [Bacteroidetes bacterium]|nr:diaminopimelate epimerase [Bacteroidota bacterium]
MATTESLSFVKMHGAGNDFVLFDNRTLGLSGEQIEELTPKLSSRNFGIGSDGVIALDYDDRKQADLVMIYKNPDGSDAGMCGNGARCFAAYAVTLGAPPTFSFRVHDNIYRATTSGSHVTIDFPLETSVETVEVDGESYLDVYTNTEHIVCSVPMSDLGREKKLVKRGRRLRTHKQFSPVGTNVNFISGTDEAQLSLQTYERGVENLTLACGTGAIASALAWHHSQDAPAGKHRYSVNVKGGTLFVEFTFSDGTGIYSDITLEGPTAFIFDGRYYL